MQLIHIADLSVTVGDPVDIGETAAGFRRVIPILGGKATGPSIKGHILPGGADFQILRKDGVTELEARYVIETASGSRIYVENRGFRHGPPEAMAKLRRGEPVDPKLIYFRAVPRFETADPALQFLTRHIYICDGARYPNRVELAFHEVR